MSLKRNKIKSKIASISTSITSFVIPIFQYVPCTAIWFGIMSVPLISYLIFFFYNPEILLYDLRFMFSTPGIYFTLFGFVFYIYSLIYQLTHRKRLIRSGPYRYMRHPQYLAFIIMTFGMTLIAFETSPVFNFNLFDMNGYAIIFFIWVAEVIAYVLLGKIEDFALKAKYGDEFLDYANNVSFMFPFLKLKRNKIEKD